MATLKYLDYEGLRVFWQGTEGQPGGVKKYVDDADALKVNISDIVNDLTTGGAKKVLSAEQGKQLKTLIDNISGGELTVPVATDAKIGGVKSGGDIAVAGDGAVTVNQAAKLKTAQTISLTGGATGSTTFDGSAAASIAVTVDPAQHQHTIAQVTDLQTTLDAKAPLASPAFTTGATIDGKDVATQEYVDTQIAEHVAEVAGAMIYKGAADDADSLPTNAEAGWTYKASAAFTLGDVEVKLGDLIVCSANSTGSAPTWDVYPIDEDGEVFGPASATADHLVAFDGATGKLVKDSAITTSSVSTAITQAGAANTALAGITGTVKNYVDTAVSGATLTAGTVTETGTNAISISGKAINITLKAYALASDLAALKTLVGSTSVSDQIDAKITAGIADGGVIDNRIDTVIAAYDTSTLATKYQLASDLVAITSGEIEGIFTQEP